MSITSQMLESSKLDTVVTFDYPETNPEFKLTFSRLSYGEDSLLYEQAFKEGGTLKGDGQAFVISYASAFYKVLEGKLKTWEHASFGYTEDNKKLFFSSLNFTQRQELVSCYQNAVAKLKEQAQGNAPTLA